MAALLQTELGEAPRDVYAILAGMDPRERIALVSHRVEGSPLEEAAATPGLSPATFRRRLARGEEKLFAQARKRSSLDARSDPGWPRASRTTSDRKGICETARLGGGVALDEEAGRT